MASQSVGLPQNPRLHLILINGGVCPVNMWQAMVEVVKAFEPKRNPKSALCAILIILSAPVIWAAVPLLLR